jgi:predicted homoserine dehydrogenase-like protein
MSEDCVLVRNIAKDSVVSFDDVTLPAPRVVDALWQEQLRRWPLQARATAAARQPTLA